MTAVKSLFLLLLTAQLSHQFQTFLNHPHNMRFLKKLLSEYSNFQVILHVDAPTADDRNRFLKAFFGAHPIAVTILNHDVDATLLRPIGLHCVNVVTLRDPARFLQNYGRTMRFNDVVIFLTDREYLALHAWDLGFLPRLARAGNTIVVETSPTLLVYGVCFYCGAFTGKLQLKEIVDANHTKVLRSLVRVKRFQRFQGHLLRVGFISYYPLVYVEDGAVLGRELSLLQMLAQKMNFTYTLSRLEANYTELFRRLHLGDFDFAIGGLSLTPERTNLAQFSTVFNLEYVRGIFIYALPPMPQVLRFFEALPGRFWGGIGAATIAMVVLSYGAMTLDRGLGAVSAVKISLIVFGNLLQQATKMSFRPYRFQVTLLLLCFTWFIFVLLTGTTYQSRSASVRIKPPPPPSIGSLDQAIHDGYNIVMDKSCSPTFIESLLNISRHDRILIQKPDFCSAYEHIGQHKSIIIDEASRLFQHGPFFCFDSQGIPPLLLNKRMGMIHLGHTVHGWPFKFGTPFADSFGRIINRIVSAGLLTKFTNFNGGRFLMRRRRYMALSLGFFLMHFMIYVACICVACCAFAVELTWVWYQRKQKKS